jgi:hypothetical protein
MANKAFGEGGALAWASAHTIQRGANSRRRREVHLVHLCRRCGDTAPAVGAHQQIQVVRARGELDLLIGRGRREPRRIEVR